MRRPAAAAILIAIGAVACRGNPKGASTTARPNILLITIDTFRADRLGVGVAPALDMLAATSLRFTSARTAVPLTLPSHTTILTGLLPPEHGVRENGIDSLSDDHQTTATILKAAGYRTAAFVGAFVLDHRFGLAQGFDTYDDQIPRDPNATERLEAERPAGAVVDRALAWLDRAASAPGRVAPSTGAPSTLAPSTLAPGTSAPGTVAPSTSAPSTLAPSTPAPFFVWLHLYDPHAPYNPPPDFVRPPTSAPTLAQRYDGEIRYADAQIARVLGWVGAHALRNNTLIVVAGDHGEGLGDHGERTHGMLLYDSTLRVPLIVSAPRVAPAARDEAVSLADVAPTVLRAAGLEVPPAMKGRDLLRVMSDRGTIGAASGTAGAPDLYAETEYPRVAGWSPLQALTDGRWMAIRAEGQTAVFDLARDPHEAQDVSSAQPTIAAAMSARIDAIHRRGGSNGRTISSDTAERLRALGYVASSASPDAGHGLSDPATRIESWDRFEDALSALNAGRAQDALAAIAPLARANPGAPVFQSTLARALQATGEPSRALAVYRAAVKRWPDDPVLFHDLSVAAREAAARSSGQRAVAFLDEAVRADRAALAIAPKSAAAHNGLGLLAIDRGQPRDAVREFEQATTIDPGNAVYWSNLGNARRAIGDASGAERGYRRAIETDARAVEAINGLGVLMVEARRPTEAIPLFERALAAAPDFQEARLNLGIALQESGQPDRAAAAYRQVLDGPPRFTRERQAAAKLLAALGGKR